MSKTIQTNFRLTEEERYFLKKLGGGDISQGLKEALMKSGYSSKNVLTIHRSKFQGSNDYVYYRILNNLPYGLIQVDSQLLPSLRKGQTTWSMKEKGILLLKDLAKRIYDISIDMKDFDVVVLEDNEVIWSSDGSHLL